jgi:hypothetical protein
MITVRCPRATLFLIALAACTGRSTRRAAGRDIGLVAAASESLTAEFRDSAVAARGYRNRTTGVPLASLSACDDRVDATGWESFTSDIIDLQLPPGFASSGRIGQRVEWRAERDGGWLRAMPQVADVHSSSGYVTSECDVFISGVPAHIDLVTTSYGTAIHATIKIPDHTWIGIEAFAQPLGRLAQLLHAIKYARVSAGWAQ